ncbi:hypothetical protein CAPTEDRAFT_67225, partial [Capitella teleta]
GVTVNFYSQGLTAIPSDITSTVTKLGLYDNQITAIRQSDLNDKYPDLDFIGMLHNRVASVEVGCFKGTALTGISLNFNKLTTFPDFREVKDTLASVKLASNSIVKVSSEEISYLSKLTSLNLKGNPL